MSKKQMSLESFFEKGERLNDETAEDSKIANKKKAAFKRKCRVLLKLRVHCNKWLIHLLQAHLVSCVVTDYPMKP